MQLVSGLCFFAMFALVSACTTTTVLPPDDENAGDENPAPTSDPAPVKKAPATTGPATGGTPTNAPAAPAAPVTPVPVKERSKMTFFVTSSGNGNLGGNLGGLVGADKKCQDLATAVQGGDHTWHAYLSVAGTNAKDRIGAGPWQNQKGTVIAKDLLALHDFQFIPLNADIVDEKGAAVPKTGTSILTGTNREGLALLQTCQDWTSNNGNQTARIGEAASETSVILGARWNDAAQSSGCSQQNLAQLKGDGRVYCFAID